MALLDYLGDLGLAVADQVVDNNPVAMMINQATGNKTGIIDVDRFSSTRLGTGYSKYISPTLQQVQKMGTSAALNIVAPGTGSIYSGLDGATSTIGSIVQDSKREGTSLKAANGLTINQTSPIDFRLNHETLSYLGSSLFNGMNKNSGDPIVLDEGDTTVVDEKVGSKDPTKKNFLSKPFFGILGDYKEGDPEWANRNERYRQSIANIHTLGSAGTMIANLAVLGAYNKLNYNPPLSGGTIDEPNLSMPIQALRSSKNQLIGQLFNSALYEARSTNKPLNLAPVLDAENKANIQISDEMTRIINANKELISNVQFRNQELNRQRRLESANALMENQRRKSEIYSGIAGSLSGAFRDVITTQLNATYNQPIK